jgi:hypothetical protein
LGVRASKEQHAAACIIAASAGSDATPAGTIIVLRLLLKKGIVQ